MATGGKSPFLRFPSPSQQGLPIVRGGFEEEEFPAIFELKDLFLGGAKGKQETFVEPVRATGREAWVSEDLLGKWRGRLSFEEREEAASLGIPKRAML